MKHISDVSGWDDLRGLRGAELENVQREWRAAERATDESAAEHVLLWKRAVRSVVRGTTLDTGVPWTGSGGQGWLEGVVSARGKTPLHVTLYVDRTYVHLSLSRQGKGEKSTRFETDSSEEDVRAWVEETLAAYDVPRRCLRCEHRLRSLAVHERPTKERQVLSDDEKKERRADRERRVVSRRLLSTEQRLLQRLVRATGRRVSLSEDRSVLFKNVVTSCYVSDPVSRTMLTSVELTDDGALRVQRGALVLPLASVTLLDDLGRYLDEGLASLAL